MYLTKEKKEEILQHTEVQQQTQVQQKDKSHCLLLESIT